jgi:hypothetical protein
MTDEPNIESNERLDGALRIIGVLILILLVAALLVISFTDWIRPDVRSMLLEHFGPFFALPSAGIFALLVTYCLALPSHVWKYRIQGSSWC